MENVRNGGEWTEARFTSFVKSGLRSTSRRWPPKYECLGDAFVGKQVCSVSGRLGKHYRCAGCNGNYAARFVQVDHINPIIDPNTGFTSWDDVVNNMFCEKHNLQVLCSVCHKAKTQSEREIATERKKKNVGTL